MLENWRYNRAYKIRSDTHYCSQLYLDEEYRTQIALARLGMETRGSPGNASGIDQLHTNYEHLESLTTPYVIEVIGMPRAGKTSSIQAFCANA